MKRRLIVEISGTIEVEFDDEIKSDWDGKGLLEIHERQGEQWTQREVLAAMAYSMAILGSWDGYADFEHAKHKGISAWDFTGGPEFGQVTIDGRVII